MVSSSSVNNQTNQIFNQYKEITARLKSKTRSLIPSKKINLQDVSDQFVSLSKQVSPFSKGYEGHCLLAAAKTERLISDNRINNEFQLLIEAARSFREDAFDSHTELSGRRQVFNPRKSHSIDSASSCYHHALKICHEPLVPVMLREVAIMYERVNQGSESGSLFLEAGCQRKSASSFLHSNQLIPALNAYEKVPYADLTTHDMISIYLLKLAANDVHVLKVASPQLYMKSSAFSLLRLKSQSMRRLSSVNIPDFFVSISFPVIPLNSAVHHQSEDLTRSAAARPSAMGTTDSSDQSAQSTSSCGSRGYQDLLLMNDETININVLLESLYYFLIEAGSDLSLLVNYSSPSEKDSTNSSTEIEDEEEDIDDEDRRGLSRKLLKNPLREARDQLFNQLWHSLKHNDHRKLISIILKPNI
jgi:hypothetical protein